MHFRAGFSGAAGMRRCCLTNLDVDGDDGAKRTMADAGVDRARDRTVETVRALVHVFVVRCVEHPRHRIRAVSCRSSSGWP